MAKARILAVDDQRYFRELIAGMLQEEGFEAQTAASGEEALHILENAVFDVVLTDLVMPGMDGSELVHRIKQRDPEQEVVVITGVVDVKTAVDAMKLGATDYILKPFDRRTLTVTLDQILRNRRLRAEHARLLAENIEYIGERTLYERALSLFATLSVEPLAARLIEYLCAETEAQGGVLWVAAPEGEGLDLAAARGLVRLSDEQEFLPISSLPEDLSRPGVRVVLAPWAGDAETQARHAALYAVFRRDDRIVGAARLTDKLDGEEFDSVDVACIEKFAHFAEVALANALRVRGLERRSLEDPSTGAYNFEYFKDALRNEIERSNRFGRTLALLRIDLGAEFSTALDESRQAECCARVGEDLKRLLRATDVIAVDRRKHFYVMLAEADALGAAVLKRRALRTLKADEVLVQRAGSHPLAPRIGLAVYPGDGAQIDALLATLEQRAESESRSAAHTLGISDMPLATAFQTLVRQGRPEAPEMAQQLARFLLSELVRHPRKRGLVYAVPGLAFGDAVREGLENLRDIEIHSDLVVISDGERPSYLKPGISWISPQRAPGLPPCIIHYGDGPAYALLREEGRNGGPARLFHSDDRGLVEQLAFRLQEELAVPPGIGAGIGQ